VSGTGPKPRRRQAETRLPPPANAALIRGRYGKPGAITLARHGEPALSRRVRLNAAEYDAWWARYELGGLKPGQTPPDALLAVAREAEVIVSSTRPRSVETAQAVSGSRGFTEDAVMVEAPLPPPRWPAFLKLKPRTWGVIARTAWWFFDAHRGRESRDQAKLRAAAAADRLEGLAAEGKDVLVLAHGSSTPWWAWS
jgi:broad specificity phosphatase PhoE